MSEVLPPIPAKRYFTIGEVSELCGVKQHVLRYWEQEFSQLRPMKRRGNRRYYQHHEVLMVRKIRDLLYDQGFTISGARNQLQEPSKLQSESKNPRAGENLAGENLAGESLADASLLEPGFSEMQDDPASLDFLAANPDLAASNPAIPNRIPSHLGNTPVDWITHELRAIRALL